MSRSQQRLSQVASHITPTRSLTTNAVVTKPATYRQRKDYKYFLPIQTR